jgi:hypothetical protein
MGSGAATLSDTTQSSFNIAQLATWEQARELAAKLGAGPIVVGGGVKPENADQSRSGIYRPDWLPGPAAFPEPHFFDQQTGLKYYFLHFRFQNGAEGMNVGLIMDKFGRFPSSPLYVMSVLAAEADSMARR